MPAFIDLAGKRFGRLVVLGRNGKATDGHIRWLCKCDCGAEKTIVGVSLTCSNTRSCGCYKTYLERSRRGDKNHSWKGGRTKTTGGYVKLFRPHQPAAHRSGYVLEHRLVMEQHLGRPLRKDEEVHHKNGVRDDNQLLNLELWSTFHPRGGRAEDLIAWAKEILSLYGPTSHLG